MANKNFTSALKLNRKLFKSSSKLKGRFVLELFVVILIYICIQIILSRIGEISHPNRNIAQDVMFAKVLFAFEPIFKTH